ncbi:DNA-binding MarR family transcriptional regulator [Rhodanobacter sp. ANJX3]|uniref:MarR family winged helix-turn-helix transcriptional regulator n=1 Tax=Rhodanobacter sp. ANJX3 TaxID=2723083 RepID=UPI00160EC32F|nr:MarR family winged helix-turn-helix transcriptional regulator [Rhodanobacter sp. ANJX3]MBB5357560.1 DNA-binding MarR family transcriptional regulator [Rhodanobacter sp. ANJX3]
MTHLTPTDASRIMFALLQKIRRDVEGGSKFTLANASTLFAALKNPGALQTDIYREVGGVKDSAISRQFDLLEGRSRLTPDAPSTGLITRERSGASRTNNAIVLTPEGEKFAAEFAELFNRLLDART